MGIEKPYKNTLKIIPKYAGEQNIAAAQRKYNIVKGRYALCRNIFARML